MFEFAHSQMEASRECPAIDVPKTFTNNLYLKAMMAKSTTRCQCGSTGDRVCCSTAAFPQRVPSLGKSWRQKPHLGAAEAPAQAQLGPAQLSSARTLLCRRSRPGRLPQAGRNHEPAGEAPSQRLNRFCCLLPPETRGVSLTLIRGWAPAPGLCLSSPGGLRGCSRVRLWMEQ